MSLKSHNFGQDKVLERCCNKDVFLLVIRALSNKGPPHGLPTKCSTITTTRTHQKKCHHSNVE